MGIMNFWKWRKNDITADNTDIAATHAIDVSKEGLRLNNILLTEMTIPALTSAFGEPRIVEPESKEPDASGYIENTVILWDSIGIRAYTKDISAGKIDELDLRLLFDEGLKTYDRTIYEPHADYHGSFTLSGKPALEKIPEKELKNAYKYFNDLKFGNWRVNIQLSESLRSKIAAMDFNYRFKHEDEVAALVRSEKHPFSLVYITYQLPRVSTGKYNQIRPDGDILSFDNFNFKLAIVNELMYEQNLIQPKFDVYDFAKDYTKREIDTFEEGDFQPIREVKKWFQELAVSAALAGKVEHLCLDAGNDIYAQLSPNWDGEDDLYDIKAISQKELAQFPNLKHIEIIGFSIDKKARTVLTTAGIQIND